AVASSSESSRWCRPCACAADRSWTSWSRPSTRGVMVCPLRPSWPENPATVPNPHLGGLNGYLDYTEQIPYNPRVEQIERAILDAWKRIRPTLVEDQEELARRLARRRTATLARP